MSDAYRALAVAVGVLIGLVTAVVVLLVGGYVLRLHRRRKARAQGAHLT